VSSFTCIKKKAEEKINTEEAKALTNIAHGKKKKVPLIVTSASSMIEEHAFSHA
jgi:hypothetical protein